MKKLFNSEKVIQAVLCCLLWSTAIPVLKISYKELNFSSGDLYQRIILAGMRFMIAAIILFIYFVIKNRKLPTLGKNMVKGIVIFGILNTTMQYIFFYTGVMNTVAVKSVILDSLKPLIVVLLAHFLKTDDRINTKKIIGLMIGFIGIAVANLTELTSGTLSLSMSFKGEGMLFLASLAYAIAILYGKKLMEKIHYLSLNLFQFFIGSSILLIIGFVGIDRYDISFTPLAIILLIYSGLLSAVVFIIWYRLISKYTPSSITIFLFLIPVFGSIISSILFAEESITANVIISLLFLIIGIVLVNYEEQPIESTNLE
ncbi:MAG: DMT family transporter [Eubacteriales bacterium]